MLLYGILATVVIKIAVAVFLLKSGRNFCFLKDAYFLCNIIFQRSGGIYHVQIWRYLYG